MKQLLCILAIAVSACLPADDAAIIDGPNYAFTISAPKGWKLTSPKDLQAAFNPEGTSFDKSPVVMYVRPADKQQLHVTSVAELNRLDLKGIRQQHPAATSQQIGTIVTTLGIEIPLYSFSGGGFSELVAYINHPKTITVFVLSADTDDRLKSARQSFDELLSSYVALDPGAKAKKKP